MDDISFGRKKKPLPHPDVVRHMITFYTEIKRVFRTAENVKSHYFYPPEGEKELNGTYAYLVITADKGLAGAYNMNVLKKAEEALNNHPDTKLYVVGE